MTKLSCSNQSNINRYYHPVLISILIPTGGFMKLVLTLVILILLAISFNLNAQDMKAKLSGNDASHGFSVLNAAGDTLFRITGDGNIGFGNGDPQYLLDVFQKFGDVAKSINLRAGSRPNSNGGDINLYAGDANEGYTGGVIRLIGGKTNNIDGSEIEMTNTDLNLSAGNSYYNKGGNVLITSGSHSGPNGMGGDIKLQTGTGHNAGGGNIYLTTSTGGNGFGNIFLYTGNLPVTLNKPTDHITGGNINFLTRDAESGGNEIKLITGTGRGTNDIILTAGDSYNPLLDGGNIRITPGITTGSGTNGLVIVNGSGTVSGTWTVSSDERFKKNIEPIKNGLDIVESLNPVKYDLRKDEFPEKKFSDKRQVGLIAQDVEKVLPEVVSTDAEGYKSIDYAKINVLLIDAIKEQQQSIELLKKEIELLKSKNQTEVSSTVSSSN